MELMISGAPLKVSTPLRVVVVIALSHGWLSSVFSTASFTMNSLTADSSSSVMFEERAVISFLMKSSTSCFISGFMGNALCMMALVLSWRSSPPWALIEYTAPMSSRTVFMRRFVNICPAMEDA